VTDHANDKQELVPAVACVDAALRKPSTVCADTGYFSEEAVTTIEGTAGAPTMFSAMGPQSHHRAVADLERKPLPEALAETAPVKENGISAEDTARTQPLQEAKENHRTRVRHHQIETGFHAVPDAGPE
jgi:hypothetical protein